MSGLKWLHITDLHFGVGEQESWTMLKNLSKVAELTGTVDCLFITGDLRYAAERPKDYPPEAETALIELRDALKVPPERVFIVPGNHDVNDDDDSKGYLRWAINRGIEKYHPNRREIDEDSLKAIQSRREPFLKLRESLCGSGEPAPHYCIQLSDFNIVCLNTALFCHKDQKDDQLILGNAFIERMFREDMNPRKSVIILAHHPLSAIHTDESRDFLNSLDSFLETTGDTILYLCGHTHEIKPTVATLEGHRTGKRHTLLTCVGGTGMSVNPKHTRPDMDVMLGEMDEKGTNGHLLAYRWDYRKGKWMPDSAFSYEPEQGMALDGCWYFPPNSRPTWSLSEDTVKREYLTWLKECCGRMESVAERRGSPTPQNLKRLFVQPRLLTSFQEILERNGNEEKHGLPFQWKQEGQSAVRVMIVSEPGGGKSTLLKWYAWVYAGQEENRSALTELPLEGDIFPVWLPCRDASEFRSMEDLIYQAFPDNFDRRRLFSIFGKYRTNGQALLLLDGLDEAGDFDRQKRFLNQLCNVLEQPENKRLHVILTVRRSGLEILTGKGDKDNLKKSLDDQHFICGVIAPLNDEEITDLSRRWWDAYGNTSDREYTKWRIHQILESPYKDLAQNPLLLTAMLFVQLRYNRLPAQLPSLYNSALEAWLEGERRTPLPSALSPEEIIRFLACIALNMMTSHTGIISKTELRSTLEELWEKRPELIQRTGSKDEFLSSFFRYLDEESVILRPITGDASTKEYEFQYRSFQEYLAALAATEFYYPGYTEEDLHGCVLEPYLTTQYWKTDMQEVILLASLISVPCGRRLANLALKEITSADKPGKIEYLRSTLLRMLEKGTPLPDELAENILREILREQPQYTDLNPIHQIFTGRYQNLMEKRFLAIGNEQHGDQEYWRPLIRLLKGEENAPYQFYRERRDSASPRLAEGISMLSCALWLINAGDELSFGDINLAHQADELKAELLQKAGDKSDAIQWHAFRALNHLIKITHGEKISPLSEDEQAQYALAYMSYLNRAAEIEKTSRLIPAIDPRGLIDSVKALLKSPDGATRIRNSHFQDKPLKRLCAFFERRTTEIPSDTDYWDLFSIAFLAAEFRGSGSLVQCLFSLIERWRDIHWKSQPTYYRMLNGHFKIAVSLWESMKDSPIYSPDEWKTVERYIFSMDRAAILHAKEHGHMKAFKRYFDVSDAYHYYPIIYGAIIKGDERDPERVCEFINEHIGEL